MLEATEPAGQGQTVGRRAGSRTLSIFSYALSADVLCAHAAGRLRSPELEQAIGWAPPSSLRAAAGKMVALGLLSRVEPGRASPAATTELTAAGGELLPVVDVLERWLLEAPGGPVGLDDSAARGTVRALTDGWDSTMIRAIAERPLGLAELQLAVQDLSYAAVKRRLAKLRSTGLAVRAGAGGASTYEATDWLRRAVAPLATAGRWESTHDSEAEPVTPFEVEAAFLLALPLVELPHKAAGRCTLAVVLDEAPSDDVDVAGFVVTVECGRVVSCEPADDAAPTTWVLGRTEAWFRAVLEGDLAELRVNGLQTGLAEALAGGINRALFRT